MIEIDHVNKKLRGNMVLQDIVLNFESGKIYGIRGKNGSGKSMLLRLIAGLIIPDSGTVKVNGVILNERLCFPTSIGILINAPGFIGRYTALKNLTLLADINGTVSQEEIRSILQRLGLDPDSKQIYRRFSLGMKQKVGIAAAVMERPQVILLDEPFNALDEDSVQIVRDLILELKESGSTIILTCHDSEELERLADETVTISAGRIVS